MAESFRTQKCIQLTTSGVKKTVKIVFVITLSN